VYDNTSNLPTRKTEDASTHANITNGNYTNFTSYITLTGSNGEIGQYNFQPRSANATDYYVWVKARITSGSNGSLTTTLITDGTPGSPQSFSCVNNTGDWLWYRFKAGTMQPLILSGLSNAYNLSVGTDGSRLLPNAIAMEADDGVGATRIYSGILYTRSAHTVL
jgi:hypothetical protein